MYKKSFMVLQEDITGRVLWGLQQAGARRGSRLLHENWLHVTVLLSQSSADTC